MILSFILIAIDAETEQGGNEMVAKKSSRNVGYLAARYVDDMGIVAGIGWVTLGQDHSG